MCYILLKKYKLYIISIFIVIISSVICAIYYFTNDIAEEHEQPLIDNHWEFSSSISDLDGSTVLTSSDIEPPFPLSVNFSCDSERFYLTYLDEAYSGTWKEVPSKNYKYAYVLYPDRQYIDEEFYAMINDEPETDTMMIYGVYYSGAGCVVRTYNLVFNSTD